VVENDPASVISGRDPQLERGISEILKALEANPKKLPSRPLDPIKNAQTLGGRLVGERRTSCKSVVRRGELRPSLPDFRPIRPFFLHAQGLDQHAQSVPENLHADTNQQERRQSRITFIPLGPTTAASRSAYP